RASSSVVGIAARLSQNAHQNVVWNASATGAVYGPRSPVAPATRATDPPPGTLAAISAFRITARTAAPIEPPTRWVTFSPLVARGTLSGRIAAYAAAIAGIMVPPRPNPRSASTARTSGYGVLSSIWVSRNVAVASSVTPTRT